MINLIIELTLAISLLLTVKEIIKQNNHINGLNMRIKSVEQAIKQFSTDSKKNISVALCNAYTVANSAENRSFKHDFEIENNRFEIKHTKADVEEIKADVEKLKAIVEELINENSK